VSEDPTGQEGPEHPVRARLLERAQRHEGQRLAKEPALPQSIEHELSQIGQVGSGPPSAARPRVRRGSLSAPLRALFGTIMGIAVLATLIVLATSLERRSEAPLNKPAPAPDPALVASPAAQVQEEPVPEPGPWRIADARSDPGLRIVRGNCREKAFLAAVQDAGLAEAQAYRALTALKDLRDMNRCAKSHEFVALVRRPKGELVAFEYIESKETIFQAREGENGFLTGSKLDLKIRRGQVKGAVAFTSSDASAHLRQAGFDPSLRIALNDALRGHTSLADISLPATLRVVVEEVTALGVFSRYAGIEALEVRSADGETLRLYYFRSDKARGYFDARGRSLHEGGWRKPVPGAPITSPFNPKRMHPVLKKLMPHNGTDFGAPTGEPVYASSLGTVKHVGHDAVNGNLVVLEHSGSIETGYAHLSRFAEGLKVGDKVKRMQLIGYVGSTGRSTGPHLHFSVKKNGVFVDPVTLDLDGLTMLPASERAAFEAARARYDTLLDAITLPALPDAQVAREVALSAPKDPALADGSEDYAMAEAEAEVEGGDTLVEPGPALLAPSPPKPKLPSPPAAKAPSQAASAMPGRNLVYLTDAELMRLQAGSDEGLSP
jgi:murein DD-endopeptidase MepM/ murein hydrolase activator NlpD